MSPTVSYALLLLIPAILLQTTGELLFKIGMNRIGGFEFSPAAIRAILPTIIRSPFIWLGFVGFGGGAVFWLAVLSRVPLSLAYPILALSYLVVVVEAWLFLHERVSWQRLAGVLVIVVGVIVVGLSEG
ncbi:MAG TPA: EamA family transporter [Anaerolineae bacterium]|nr:EamA family transporter [Anaerolineae bacterium]